MAAREKAKIRVEREVCRLEDLLDRDVMTRNGGPLSEEADRAVSRAIHLTAGACAVIAVQPLPFADIFILTPIQVTLAYKVARVRGQEISKEQARRVLGELAGVVGLGFLAHFMADRGKRPVTTPIRTVISLFS